MHKIRITSYDFRIYHASSTFILLVQRYTINLIPAIFLQLFCNSAIRLQLRCMHLSCTRFKRKRYNLYQKLIVIYFLHLTGCIGSPSTVETFAITLLRLCLTLFPCFPFRLSIHHYNFTNKISVINKSYSEEIVVIRFCHFELKSFITNVRNFNLVR